MSTFTISKKAIKDKISFLCFFWAKNIKIFIYIIIFLVTIFISGLAWVK